MVTQWRALVVGVGSMLGLALSGQAPAAVSTSCATPDNNSTITTCFYDLTASPSSTQTPASAVLNGGIFRVPAENGDLGKGTIVGTGVFQPFVRIQEQGNGNGIEAGFNTDDGSKPLDDHDKGGKNWNHSIRLGDIPTITVCDGGGTTGSNCKDYYEFLLDSNEQGKGNPNSGISLDEFKVFTAASGNLSAYTGDNDNSGFSSFNLTGATLKYDMDAGLPGGGGDASLLMDYANFSGSGNGVDLQALVPVTSLGTNANDFVYLYSKFGWTDLQCVQKNNGTSSDCLTPDGTTGAGVSIAPAHTSPANTVGTLDFSSDAGFEEWSIRKKSGTTPLPASSLLLGIGLAALLGMRRRGARSPAQDGLAS